MQQYELFKSIHASNLKSRAKNVMSCLITYMNTSDNSCFPSIKTIAKCCGMGVNTVKRALNDLVEAGFVEKESRFIETKNGAQTSNLYLLSAVVTAPEPPKNDKDEKSEDTEHSVISFDDLKVEQETTKPDVAACDNEIRDTQCISVPKRKKAKCVVAEGKTIMLSKPVIRENHTKELFYYPKWAAPQPIMIPP